LLPSLTHLRCIPATEMLFFSTSPLCHVHLEIKNTDQDPTVGTFLRTLADKRPRLPHLAVIGNLNQQSLAPICEFKHLRSLVLRDTIGISNDLLHAIAAFSHITRVEIDLRGVEHAPECIWPQESFQSLENLTIYGTLCQFSAMMGALSTKTLTSIDLFVTQTQTRLGRSQGNDSEDWRRYFEALVSRSRLSLRRIQVDYPGPVSFRGKKMQRTRSIIEPLLQIPGLEYVNFFSRRSLLLSDEDVHEIASAWPNIVTLNLPHAHNERPTVTSLVQLARLCPCLTSLKLNIDMNNMSAIEYAPTSTHPLRSWIAGDTQIDRPTFFIRHLHRIFPSLDRIDCVNVRAEHVTIHDLIDLCRAIVADERVVLGSYQTFPSNHVKNPGGSSSPSQSQVSVTPFHNPSCY